MPLLKLPLSLTRLRRIGLYLMTGAVCYAWACVNSNAQRKDEAERKVEEAAYLPVTIYTKPYCPYCLRAKSFLHGKGVKFDEIDVDGDAKARNEMIERSQRKTVPQIFVGTHHVGGYDDLMTLERQGRFNRVFKGQEKP